MQGITTPYSFSPCAVIAKVAVSPATYVTGVATEVTVIAVRVPQVIVRGAVPTTAPSVAEIVYTPATGVPPGVYVAVAGFPAVTAL